MKKLFTFAMALMGFAGVSQAATIDDVQVCKHSYVLCFDDWNGNGTGKPGKGSLFGDGYFLDVTGGSVSTGKGQVNLSIVNEADDNHVTQYIADKYGAEYPDYKYNSWRLKNAQDVIAMKVTAGSKLIFFLQGNNKTGKDARIPKIATDAKLENPLNAAPTEEHPTTDSGFRYEWTAEDDNTIYIGTYNGDTYFSYLIVEANEAEGTPSVKVGEQTFADGLWFREVTCTPRPATMFDQSFPTVVTYTTDGTAPTAESPKYTEPIKCYNNQTIKFQAFLDFGGGAVDPEAIVPGADNEANVNFKFNAPTIEANGANVTITSPYAEQGGTNYYTLNGGEPVAGNSVTLTESATISAYTAITNGSYGIFTSAPTSKDVYVLNPIKEKKVIAVTAGEAVLDEEATETSTTGPVYKVEGGAISADKMDFFVKNLTFAVLKDDNAQYQVPEGQEIYIKMSDTNITFQVAEGDSVNVKVICSKNACKNINADDAEDGSAVNDRKCYVTVSGTNYGGEDLKLNPDGNVIEFGLAGGKTYTFQKYSGTGNILISSIEITPASAEPAEPGTLIGEKDWTTETTYPYYNMGVPEGASYDVQDGLLVVNNTVEQADIWGLQLFVLDWINLTQGNNYVVRIYASIPVAGQVQVNMGTWNGNDQHVFDVTASEAIKAYDFKFDNYAGETTTANNAHVLWQQGKLLATVKIAKVQVFEVASEGIINTIAEKAQNNIRYNLAGERVNANYKGIVIVNGKKFFQK